jgi:hypothetical protein
VKWRSVHKYYKVTSTPSESPNCLLSESMSQTETVHEPCPIRVNVRLKKHSMKAHNPNNKSHAPKADEAPIPNNTKDFIKYVGSAVSNI